LAELSWIAVDWGTSNVRAWGIGADDSILFERELPKGMGKIGQSDYPSVLEELVGAETADRQGVEVVVCGMAGARQGWREAQYVNVPTDLGAIVGRSVRPDNTRFSVRILPGLDQHDPDDVMRGEETQLLGLRALLPEFNGTVVMPGTHSKWVSLAGGRVERFETAMTGELFDVLGTHSVLRHSLNGEQIGPYTEEGVYVGVGAGLDDPQRVTSLLFRTRASALLSQKGPDWCFGYLSGLLVGAEIGGHRDWIAPEAIPLIGSGRLNRIYAAAFSRIGVGTEQIDAKDATLAGLRAARRLGA
jgi:2-dehydro-3-deoxygalactonokinase